jgi:hypothetical protein
MRATKLTLVDGTVCLAIPGVGVAVPGRDREGRVIIGEIVLLVPGMPPMPLRETLDSLEEKFNGAVQRISL